MSMAPFLMFQNGQASAALDFYVATFPDAAIDAIERYGEGEGGVPGTIKRGRITIAGQAILCTDSGITHAFDFTPSISFFRACASEEEVRGLAAALSADGGTVLMPPANYGFSRLFAWVGDRFGVTWQLDLA